MMTVTDRILSVADIMGGLSAFFVFLCLVLFYIKTSEPNYIDRQRMLLFFGYKTFFTLVFILLASGGGDTLMFYTCTLKLSDLNADQLYDFFTHLKPSLSENSYLSVFGQYRGYMTNAGNAMTVRIGFLVGSIFNQSYTALCLLFSYFSFFGAWFLYKGLRKMFPDSDKAVSVACLYLPSVGFWSSGYLKDPLTYGCFCFLLYFIMQVLYFKNFKKKYFVLAGFFILLILIIKNYIILCTLLCFGFIFIFESSYFKKRKKLTHFLILCVVVLFLIFSQKIFSVIVDETKAGTEYYSKVESGSYVKLFEYDTSFFGVFKMIFLSFFGVFYRPFLWEVKSFSMLLAAFESLFLSVITFRAIQNFKHWKQVLRSNSFLIFCILFSFVFSIIVGFSTFNFGTVSRYKMPAVPLIFIFFFLLTKKENKKRNNKNTYVRDKRHLSQK